MAADTKFDICSQALALVGVGAIASFDDGTTESAVAGQLYEPTVEAQIASYPWRFATVQEVLVPLLTAPEGRWARAYALPSDCLTVNALTLADQPVSYDRYENMVYCDLGADDQPVVDYTYRALESLWPPYFVAALRFELAGLFAGAIPRNDELARLYAERAEIGWRRAKHADAKQQTTRRVRASRLLTFR